MQACGAPSTSPADPGLWRQELAPVELARPVAAHPGNRAGRTRPARRGPPRELCALARVNMVKAPENRTGRPTVAFTGRWSPAQPPAAPSPRETPAEARCVDHWGSASRLGDWSTRSCARDVPRPVSRDCAARCRGHCAPAFQRRSLWLDQASARRALAVPPRRSSDASASATTLSRCSPEPPVRSRRPPGAAT